MRKSYIFILVFLCFILGGCSTSDNASENINDGIESYSDNIDEITDSSTQSNYGTSDDIEQLLGVPLSEYRDNDTGMGRVKTEVFNGLLNTGESDFISTDIEDVKQFFRGSENTTVAEIIKHFGKPSKIIVYRNSRYSIDAHVRLEWSYKDISTTEYVQSLEVNWNIWGNKDKSNREVEVSKYSDSVGYNLRTKIISDGVIQ